MTNKELSLKNILYVEDNEYDADIFRRAFDKSDLSFNITDINTAEKAIEVLSSSWESFDLIITDFKLPQMNGLELIIKLKALNIQLPSILLTGAGSENLAVEALKSGAENYIIKDNKSGYLDLLPLVSMDAYQNFQNRISCKQAEEEKEQLIIELQSSLAEVKKLSGLIPICATCKKIRDDKGFWNQIEKYITEHSEALFTHGVCPECASEMLAELKSLKKKKLE